MSENSGRNEEKKSNAGIDSMSTNVYSSKDNKSLHKSLNGQFLLYQSLIERLLDENNELPNAKSRLSEYFKNENQIDIEILKEFDFEYNSSKAIHWYTRDTCIYKILNKSLRTLNIDHIIPFSQFIRDLNHQLKQLNMEFSKIEKSPIITVYRGQLISKDEINRLKSSKGQFISVNSFLSTSKNKEKALEFLKNQSSSNDQLTRILLEMNVNIKISIKPLADIKDLSAFSSEEEILFMFGCIFRIDNVWYDQQINSWRAKLTLCNDEDLDIKQFSSSLDQELKGENKFISLGIYLIEMQKYKDAEEHYQKFLDNHLLKNSIEFAYCYYGLSQVNQIKGEYQLSINHLNKTLNYLLKDSINNDHILISKSYNDLAFIYLKEKNYLLSFHFYDKALKTINNDNATTYSGLAKIHFKLENYYLALEYLQKTLENQSITDYSFIANTFIDMGLIYNAINQKEKASEMFNKAMESQLKFLPSEHPDLSYTYIAQGNMYSNINDQQKAFQYYQKAYQLQLESLPNNHHDFGITYKHFADLYMKKEDLDQALLYYHKSLENHLKTLLSNNPLVIDLYRIIANIYLKKKDYEQALIYFHKVLDGEIQRFQFGNPIISVTYQIIADIYLQKQDLDQALVYYHKLLQNELATKLYEDASLIDVYQSIANIYYGKRLLNQALLYSHRLLDCYFRKEVFNESTLSKVYKMIGKIYLKKRHYSDTLLSYVKLQNESFDEKLSLKIEQNIDNIHFEKRHLDQSLNYFETELNQQIKLKDPLIDQTYQILGNIYLEKQEYDKALSYFHKFLDNQLIKKNLKDPSLINIYQIIANIYYKNKNYNQALDLFYRLIDCLIQITSLDDKNIIHIYSKIGKIYLKKENFNQTYRIDFKFEQRYLDQAFYYFNKLLENKSKNSSLKSLNIDSIYKIIGNIQIDKQDFHQALIYFNKLLNYQIQKKNSEENLLLANTYSIIGDIYFILKDFDQSLNNYQNSLNIYQKLNPINQDLIIQTKYKIKNVLLPFI